MYSHAGAWEQDGIIFLLTCALLIATLRTEDLISSGSLTQNSGFTEASTKWAHSKLRNYFIDASVESEGKSKAGSY